MKKILIINSEPFETVWFDYLSGILIAGYKLEIKSNDMVLLNHFRAKGIEVKKLVFFVSLKNKITSLMFFLLRPVLFLVALLYLLVKKTKYNVDAIVCFGLFEKLHFSRAAKLLGIKVIWIMNPCRFSSISTISKQSLARVSKSVSTVCLSDYCKKKLESKDMNIKNVKSVRIGISSKQNSEQKNIFERLALTNSQNHGKKYFTIGTIQNLNGNVDHIEKLLHAVKNCIGLIPHIQLIVVGEGPERKNLSWMARKMEIADLIWFVGNHKNPQKWLSNFDIYVATTPNPTLYDLNSLLLASLSSLSVIAPAKVGFDEYLIDEQTGLLKNIDDSEELSRAIIDLQQNPDKRERLGKNGHLNIQNNFQLPRTIKQLTDLIEA